MSKEKYFLFAVIMSVSVVSYSLMFQSFAQRSRANNSEVNPYTALVENSLNHRIFATEEVYSGALGGIEGADSICQNSAAEAGLPGTWKAMLGDSTTSARSHIAITGNIFNMRNEIVADGADSFWQIQIEHPISLNQFSKEIDSNLSAEVWTGTASTCLGWTSETADNTGTVGSVQSINAFWSFRELSCSEKARLYCISANQ